MASQDPGAAGGGSEGEGKGSSEGEGKGSSEGEGEGEGEGAAKIGKPFRICSVADTCDYCGQYSTTKRCSLCHDARYCDMICLQKHRSDHRGQCLLIQEERAKKEAKERARAKVLEGLGRALFCASFDGKAARVSQLLKAGIDVNFVVTSEGGAKGGFPLIVAAQKGHVEVVRLLLAAQAQVNQVTDGGLSACHNAAVSGHAQVLEMLLEAGADVELKFCKVSTALDLAILYKQPAAEAVIRKHLKAKLETVAYVETKEAKERARAKVLEGLGVELHNASFLGEAARVSQLLKLGIDVNFVVTKEGDGKGSFPLFVAAQEGQVEVVRLLLAAEGVSVNQAKTTGATALFIACQENHVEVVRLLLAAEGVEVNRARTTGATPLFMACQVNHVEVVRLLLACEGVSVNQARTEDGNFPLLMACQVNHVEVVRLLLAAHAQVNQVKDGGLSACHIAAMSGHAQVLEMLLEAGADAELKSCSGRTALDMAILFEQPAAEAIIRKHLGKLEDK